MSPAFAGSTFIRPHLNIGHGDDRPDGVNSLPELIKFVAEHNPDHLFGLQSKAGEDVPPCEITFAQLQSAVEYASAWLVKTGSTTGRTTRAEIVPPVAILLGSDIGIFIYLAALLRIGTPVLLLSARLTPVAIAHLISKTTPTTILISSQVSRASKETLTLLQKRGGEQVIPKFLDALSYEDLLDSDHPALHGISIPPVYSAFQYEDRDAMIYHSSGTTGLPKPIFHAHAYILGYAACHRLPQQREPFRFCVSTLPLYHGFGILAPSLSLSIGLPFILPPASVIPTARSTLHALQSSGAQTLLSVPSILEDMLGLPGTAGLEALKKLEIIAIGGAPMKETVGEELVSSGVKLLNHWGATEIGAIAPIERVPRGYDWHYLRPRTDMGLQFIPLDDGSNTYRLIGQAPGWKEPYVVQDLLVPNPRDKTQFKIMGRADDLLVLATGEKVRPANMEKAVAEHPDVKSVLAFGDGQLSLGLIIEIASGRLEKLDLDRTDHFEQVLASIDPYLEQGNSFTDKHGKVTREMIIFTRETGKRLARTDKGSLSRKENYALFKEEITACYERADTIKAIPLPLPSVKGGLALLEAIRSMVYRIMEVDELPDEADLFEQGMDSLQASRLRRVILSALLVTPDLPSPVETLAPDFCFQNSSIEKLHRALIEVMDGTNLDDLHGENREAKRIAAMVDMVERYRFELVGYAEEALRAREIRRQNTSICDNPDAVVLLTGSTGSLGCFLLARLANDPTVSKVICFNRPNSGSVDPRRRQLDLMYKRGAFLSPKAWNKVIFHAVDMSRPDFGLNAQNFAELLQVTHMIHNAWPVNFNRSLSSFEPHVKALSNLVRLSILSAGTRPMHSDPTRLLFASSIAVVGRYPILYPTGSLDVPETALNAECTAQFGYPEAKWVCERVLTAATELYGDLSSEGDAPLLRASSVRIGQMTGAEGSGAWNKSEHFPIIVRTSRDIGALPALDGSLSWMPVNRAGDAISELLFSRGFKPFYHMENPSRQSWTGVLENLASIIGGPTNPLPLFPFHEWLDRIRALGDDPKRNPAYKVLDFLEKDFVRMATGTVVLSTVAACVDSPSMVRSASLDRRHLEEYVAYWEAV